MDDLAKLAELFKEKNSVDNKVASLIGRPAQVGHAGEYIAATIFGIRLHKSATHYSSDGIFISGSLAGRTVDIKWYLKHESVLDLNPKNPPDYYLVLTGPKSAAISSRDAIRPWVIESVFLFDANKLINAISIRGIRLGIATSVVVTHWNEAEIYPVQQNKELTLSTEQRMQLAYFHPTKIGV